MSVWDTRYPEHVAVHRSVNGGLVHVGFSVTPVISVSAKTLYVFIRNHVESIKCDM